MKMIHATTTHVLTYVRMALILVASIALVLLVPTAPMKLIEFFYYNALNLGVLYAITMGFLMTLTLNRRQTMEEYIALELNKIRRLYHLAYHLQRANPKLGPWFKNVHRAIEGYLHEFKRSHFGQYGRGNTLFRKVTYAMYSLPATHVPYDSDLYQALLETTAAVTEAREFIRSKKDHHIGRFQWAVTIAVTTSFCILIAAFTPTTPLARTVSVLSIFCIFLTLQLVYEYDRSNIRKNKYIARLYVNNYAFIKHPDQPDVEP